MLNKGSNPNFNKHINFKYIEKVTLVCTKLHKWKFKIAKAPYRGKGDTHSHTLTSLGRFAPSQYLTHQTANFAPPPTEKKNPAYGLGLIYDLVSVTHHISNIFAFRVFNSIQFLEISIPCWSITYFVGTIIIYLCFCNTHDMTLIRPHLPDKTKKYRNL